MTDLLLRLFIPAGKDSMDPAVRAKIGSLSGFVGIICNLLLFGGKLLVGILASSVSVTADALNNLSDATSSIVTLMGFRLAEKPADAHHPYGHARFEYLSALAVAVLILFIGFELAKTSLSKILNPSPVAFSLVTAGVLTASLAVKLWMYFLNRRLSRMIQSQTLLATAQDSRNDCLATGAVLAAGMVEAFTDLRVDGWMGMGVALFILLSGWNMARDTISPLLGEAADPQLKALIADYITGHPKVLGIHDLMVHDYGPGQRFASLHVEMDRDEDPLVCHEIIDDMERECYESHGIHLVIHYDPVVTGDPELDRMRNLVASILRVRDQRLSIHDFRMVPGTGHTNLIFDLAVPSDLRGQEKAIQQALEGALNDLGEGTFYTVITFDQAELN